MPRISSPLLFYLPGLTPVLPYLLSTFFLFSAVTVACARSRTADTALSLLFCLYEVSNGRSRQDCHNAYDNHISHKTAPFTDYIAFSLNSLLFRSFSSIYLYVVFILCLYAALRNSYSTANCLFVLRTKTTTTAAITATAISPGTKPAPGAPVVTSVPI